MNAVVNEIRAWLMEHGDETIRESTRQFFKEEIRSYGLKAPEVATLAKERFKSVKGLPKAEILALCDDLWSSGYLEESGIACAWSYALRKEYTPDDFATFERWVENRVSNWAACDTLCNHTVGTFIEMYPEYLPELERWAVSRNRWTRRAAAVSLIVPARNGRFLSEVFVLARLLMQDQDDLVQKGYGWLLKAASQAHGDEVFAFVMEYRSMMPRTALRYAIEKMDKARKSEAMAR